MRETRLYLALVLCALACVASVFGGPDPLKVVFVGGYVILTPGLVLSHLLRIGDELLSFVITLMTGPVVWILIASVATFSGLWAPTATIVTTAALLGLLCIVLLRETFLGDYSADEPTVAPSRHVFEAELTEDVPPGPVDEPGRDASPHRGAFPSPYDS